jgi:hypothetical protein
MSVDEKIDQEMNIEQPRTLFVLTIVFVLADECCVFSPTIERCP